MSSDLKINLQQSKFYFASNFTWWIFHLMFPVTDALEEELDEDLLEKLDDFYSFEEVGEFYYGQIGKPGLAFVNEGETESIYGCVIQYESQIQRMFDAVNQLARIKKYNDHRYELYAQFKLLEKIILQHKEFVRALEVKEYEEIYLVNKGLVDEFMNWLTKTITELKHDLGETYDVELNDLLAELAKDWVTLVEKASEKHFSR